jgi:predicted TIM-barrel enzyme
MVATGDLTGDRAAELVVGEVGRPYGVDVLRNGSVHYPTCASRA